MQVVLVGIGGFIGANLRYLISLWAAGTLGTSFPYGTLIVNGLGSFILGALMGLSQMMPIKPEVRLFVGTGMMGALTTFSTFSYETAQMLRSASYALALLNTALNLFISLLAVWLGHAVVRLWE